MNRQSVVFAVWLGIAVVALVCGNLYQWHTRRLLNGHQQDSRVQQVSQPAQVAELAHSAATP